MAICLHWQAVNITTFPIWPLFSPFTPQLGLSSSISCDSLKIQNAYIVAFFDQYLRENASALLDAASSLFGGNRKEMSKPIALQLYTVRESLAQDFTATINYVAAAGYTGVETAGFPGITPQAAAELFHNLGLTIVSAHAPLPLGDKEAEVLDPMAHLGTKRLVLPGCRLKLMQLLTASNKMQTTSMQLIKSHRPTG